MGKTNKSHFSILGNIRIALQKSEILANSALNEKISKRLSHEIRKSDMD
jgi:hypothetical protein